MWGWYGAWKEDQRLKKQQQSDPLRHLDPELKKFLERESPVKYRAAVEQGRELTPDEIASATEEQKAFDAATKPKVPKESLFQDGRYAHLWKTYRPLADIESSTMTDQDKLKDIVDSYKQRKSLIAKAALENCAEEQWKYRQCMMKGGYEAKTTLCTKNNRAFLKCYGTNMKLLSTLGFIARYGRDRDLEDDIQIHAHDIYKQMVQQEAAIKEARQAGQPVPSFPPLLPQKSRAEEEAYISTLPPAQQDRLRDALDNAEDETERARIFTVFQGYWQGRREFTKDILDWRREVEKKRFERIDDGVAGPVDRAMGLWAKAQIPELLPEGVGDKPQRPAQPKEGENKEK